MKVDIKVPAVGESITEATIGQWLKNSGDLIKRDDVILTLETDKASVEVVSEHEGVLQTSAKSGETVQVGAVIGTIDSEAQSSKPSAPPKTTPVPNVKATEVKDQPLSPAVRRVVEEQKIDPKTITGTGKDGRLTKADVEQKSTPPAAVPKATPPPQPIQNSKDDTRREPMSTLRKKIAERLVEAQQTAAILTTFNEVDMSAIMNLRSRYKDSFKEKHNVGLGFMSFFVRAVIAGLKAFPKVNARLDKTDIVYNNNYHIGIAVGTERGLMVPVIRNAQNMSLSQIEQSIRDYAVKARDGKISVDDLSGGTFTITNGGVYGSLMSTPILNPPQSGILGMHKIEDRAVVINGKVEIRPMMYLALSYDHRMVDGQESVSFLVKVKESLEDPQRLLLEI